MLKNIFIIILLIATPLCAEESDWSKVQSLHPGRHVGVIYSNLKRTEGEVRSVSDTAITVDDTTIPKDQVARVYTIGRTNRLTRTLIGVGAGLALGLIVNGTVGHYFRNEGSDPAAGIFAGSIGAGAALGALSGNGQSTIYRR